MTICPFARWRPVPSHSGPMAAHLGLVLHVQVGNNSCYGQFSVSANQASSTWWVGKDGTLEQYVDADLAAWTEAAGNSTWDSVETEGVPGEALTDHQIATLGRLYAWAAPIYGWPHQQSDAPDQRGLGWHGMGGAAWGNHPGCPGDIRKAQRPAILAAAQGGDDLTPEQATQLDEIHQALRGKDGAVDPAGTPMDMHWTLAWVWYTLRPLAAKLDTWLAAHP